MRPHDVAFLFLFLFFDLFNIAGNDSYASAPSVRPFIMARVPLIGRLFWCGSPNTRYLNVCGR